MNSAMLSNIARFFLLLAAQILLFNNLSFFGYLNPFPYVLFILLFPVNGNKFSLLLASFSIGIIMDMFCNSGGVHAAACVTLAYLRPNFFRFSFGVSYEYQTIRINDKLTPERFSFILTTIVTHHTILFILETFRINFVFDMLFKIILSSIFTISLVILMIYLFKPNKR